MANLTIAAGQVGIYQQTLVANTVDTVTISRQHAPLEIWTDGTAAVYFTVDGSTPTVGGQGGYEIPAASGGVVRDGIVPVGTGNTVVKLISAGTPKYSVTAPGGI